MTTFLDLVTNIASDLHQAGFTKDADELHHLSHLALDQNLSENARTEAFKLIEMRCHIKWLGDLYLPHMSQKDWWAKLEKLRKLTKKHMRSG